MRACARHADARRDARRTARTPGITCAAIATACGGGEPAPATQANETQAAATSADCKAASEHNSLAHATCRAKGVDSLDPGFSASFKAPQVDSSGCHDSATLVFYAADDWMRLAQKLAADAYPCAEYLVSIPPSKDGGGTYTMPRADQVKRLHDLGSRFHAMAEIRVTAWQEWLEQHPGKTWYDAGVEARRRMAKVGYVPKEGDTWAVNELPLAILTDRGLQRNMRELVRGLHEGTGEEAAGLVYAVTLAQDQTDVGAYKDQMKGFLANEPFWREMSRSVRFWAEEVYARSRNCCVGGTDPVKRSEQINDYLQHRLMLARSGPDSVETAKEFLSRAYTPIANAAWAWSTAYGYTDIPALEMQRFVSEQAFAIRRFEETALDDRFVGFGFAWAPVAPAGISHERFAADTARVLERMAKAIDDSYREERAAAACGAGDLWCRCRVPDASFNEAWRRSPPGAEPS